MNTTDNNPSQAASLTPRQIAFSFRGRISRATFWIALLCLLLCYVAFVFAMNAVPSDSPYQDRIEFALWILYFPWAIWATLAVQVKRWHDLDVTGWAVLINLVPIINILVLIYLAAKNGTPEANRYGPKPTFGTK
jgi:uncharacterized membrane protein YhaH (DUF805 family)